MPKSMRKHGLKGHAAPPGTGPAGGNLQNLQVLHAQAVGPHLSQVRTDAAVLDGRIEDGHQGRRSGVREVGGARWQVRSDESGR